MPESSCNSSLFKLQLSFFCILILLCFSKIINVISYYTNSLFHLVYVGFHLCLYSVLLIMYSLWTPKSLSITRLGVLLTCILLTYPIHFIRCALITPIKFGSWYNFLNSWFVLLSHLPFTSFPPYIHLNNFLFHSAILFYESLLNTNVSHENTSVGRTIV